MKKFKEIHEDRNISMIIRNIFNINFKRTLIVQVDKNKSL